VAGQHFNGWILTSDGLREGSLTCEEGTIVEISAQKRRDAVGTGLILPLFINSHSHLGDAAIQAPPTGTLEELVAPPHGLKHRMLAELPDSELTQGTRRALHQLWQEGVHTVVDFREQGLRGANQLRSALDGESPHAVLYGRPTQIRYDRRELDQLLPLVDGIGISAARDWAPAELERLRKHVRSTRKGFAMHASEAVREEIDGLLELEPDFLIHMMAATDDDLIRCAEANVPIVVCTRSSRRLGFRPDIPRLRRCGVEVHIGTDNAMLAPPSILAELQAAFAVARERGGLAPEELLAMAASGPRKVLRGHANMPLDEGSASNFLVVQIRSADPLVELLTESAPEDIVMVCRGERLWKRSNA